MCELVLSATKYSAGLITGSERLFTRRDASATVSSSRNEFRKQPLHHGLHYTIETAGTTFRQSVAVLVTKQACCLEPAVGLDHYRLYPAYRRGIAVGQRKMPEWQACGNTSSGPSVKHHR